MNGTGGKRKMRKSPLQIAWAFVVMILLTAGFFLALPFFLLFKKAKTVDRRWLMVIAGVAAAAVIGVLIAFVYWFNTRINAQEVYFDGRMIGRIGDVMMDANRLSADAIDKLIEKEKTEVTVNESVALKPVHFKGHVDTVEYIVGELFKEFTYKVKAVEVTVEGESIVTVLNMRVADEILDAIIKQYYQDGITLADAGFAEVLGKNAVWVESREVSDRDTAERRLTALRTVATTYRVQPGDTLWVIERERGVSVDELLRMNPQLGGDPTRLMANTDIIISASEPLLTVRTRELIERQVTVPFPKEERATAARLRTEPPRVIQQGRDGKNLLREYIVRENGLEVRRETFRVDVIEEPVTEITEVGTG
jgi:LysM repeat protein